MRATLTNNQTIAHPMMTPWLKGTHNEIVGYDVHLSNLPEQCYFKERNLYDLPKPEECSGIRHSGPSRHLQAILRRDWVRCERGRVPHIPRVPIVDVRETTNRRANLLDRSQ